MAETLAVARKPYEMSFAEFAETVKPSGAVNRWPDIGGAKEVLSYSVYMNGPSADDLPEDLHEQHFRDVLLRPLTDQVGLDSTSFRDTLKVAELVATRQAWMVAVITADKTNEHAAEILDDYQQLSDGFSHPWLQQELLKQQAMNKSLPGLLKDASGILGMSVSDTLPEEVSRGLIVSSNQDFTLQALEDGKVVTHENRRLAQIPTIGQDVTVTYYKGSGQIFDNAQNMTMSLPYIDPTTQDLAIGVMDRHQEVKQIVLFSGVAAFAKFAEEQALDRGLVEQAIDLRAQYPKRPAQTETATRQPLTGVYIDPSTQALAIDYREHGRRNTLLFGSLDAVEAHAEAFDITPAGVAQAKALEGVQRDLISQHIVATNKLAKDEVRTLGPGELRNQAKIEAARKFPGDLRAQQEFTKRVDEHLREQGHDKTSPAQEKPATGKDDKER